MFFEEGGYKSSGLPWCTYGTLVYTTTYKINIKMNEYGDDDQETLFPS